MRREPRFAEKLLWEELRDRKLGGYKFKRQHLLGNYIVDVVCLKEKLIVELDGGVHKLRQTDDAVREAILRVRGFHVLRFTNEDVIRDLPAVLLTVRQALERRTPSP
jgi:5-methyltetrahydrofolate--homocysteine methyltransferase